jgi:hypothetical protein
LILSSFLFFNFSFLRAFVPWCEVFWKISLKSNKKPGAGRRVGSGGECCHSSLAVLNISNLLIVVKPFWIKKHRTQGGKRYGRYPEKTSRRGAKAQRHKGKKKEGDSLASFFFNFSFLIFNLSSSA